MEHTEAKDAVPTRVGVNPLLVQLESWMMSCPHSRGGEPLDPGQYLYTYELSPLAWG